MIRTPTGMMSEAEALALFEQVGFSPPPGMSTQDAFVLLLQEAQRQMQQEAQARPGRGRTAERPSPATPAAAIAVLEAAGATVEPMAPCGCEIKGIDIAAYEGTLPPALAGALEVLMAEHGLVLFRGQGREQNESGIQGRYLSAEQQCKLSECFGAGELHSTHGVHPEAPCRDIFRLSNDPEHGFNSVGPEWHNDGSFCREVFGHVVYHIIKAPEGAGNTQFAHLGKAYEQMSLPVQARMRRCASVNSNGGAVHPMAAPHPISGRVSLYLHLGMTGAILERVPTALEAPASPPSVVDARFGDGTTPSDLPGARQAGEFEGLKAWRPAQEMDPFFCAFSDLLDAPEVCYAHKWQQGDVVIIDNLAVAHKAAPGAHTLESGLRILHRTTILSARPHDPPAELGMPHTLPTTGACPFEAAAGWFEGYVGFRWGAWNERAVPH